MQHLLNDNFALIQHITRALHKENHRDLVIPAEGFNFALASSVLFLLGKYPNSKRDSTRLCLILNKRSPRVKQPGDLCCPGGSIAPRLDNFLSTLIKLPFMPLGRWPYWSHWRRHKFNQARILAILLACALRESVEEMRLNPFGLTFLGMLPPQSLVMFERVIYPLVGYVNHQNRFYPNWEVEKLVYIPLTELLKPENYARYRLKMGTAANPTRALSANDFPCFLHRYKKETEILWGATYQITTAFLEYVFGFQPPDMSSLPVVNGRLDDNYLTGNR
jgi:8-oxo-dGTP pyrophosphatase MutT (NUDIX family)